MFAGSLYSAFTSPQTFESRQFSVCPLRPNLSSFDSRKKLVKAGTEMTVQLITQTIESQYLDLEKLSGKLSELFPGVDCEIEVRLPGCYRSPASPVT